MKQRRSLSVLCLVLLATILSTPAFAQSQWITNGSDIYYSDGKVGIGTATPGAKVDVVGGSVRASGDIIPGGNGVLRAIVPLAMPGGEAVVGSSGWQRVTKTNYSSISELFAGAPLLPGSTRLYYLVIRRADNVTGNGVGSQWRFACDGLWSGGNDIPGHGFTLHNNWGSLGEGTTDWVPIPPTSVSQACPNAWGQYWKIDAVTNNNGATRVMSISMAAVDVYGGTAPAYAAAAAGNDTLPALSVLNDNVWATVSGNIGIGTTTPQSKLHVSGDVAASGNVTANAFVGGSVQATYQDVAEWVPASKPIAAGTVVIVDKDVDNQVLPSSTAYDTGVAGVVSDSPGVLLGVAGEGKVKVATTGRVKVRVDASKGRINKGDLLVTSDKEGVAMKSEPMEFAGRRIHQPGTLVGKALQSLKDGEGEILVLLSLQ